MIDTLSATPDCRHLIVTWEDGAQTRLSAETLRQQAKDAHSTRARLDYGTIAIADGLTITGLTQVGPAGVNVQFSDGHNRAIYPFVYLRELSEQFGK